LKRKKRRERSFGNGGWERWGSKSESSSYEKPMRAQTGKEGKKKQNKKKKKKKKEKKKKKKRKRSLWILTEGNNRIERTSTAGRSQSSVYTKKGGNTSFREREAVWEKRKKTTITSNAAEKESREHHVRKKRRRKPTLRWAVGERKGGVANPEIEKGIQVQEERKRKQLRRRKREKIGWYRGYQVGKGLDKSRLLATVQLR